MKTIHGAGERFMAIGEAGPTDVGSVNVPSRERYKHYPDAPFVRLEDSGRWPLATFLRETVGLTRQRFYTPEIVDEDLTITSVQPPHLQQSGLMRAVPSGGALYPYELYLVAHDAELPDGLYHFDVLGERLASLNAGTLGSALAHALGRSEVARWTVILTCCFARNASKYGDFGYRVHSVDLGVVVGQAEAAARRQGWTVTVRYLFDDTQLDRLLGLEPDAEAAYVVMELGRRLPVTGTGPAPVPAVNAPSLTGAKRWPHLWALHQSARLGCRPQATPVLHRRASDDAIHLPHTCAPHLSLAAVWQRKSALHAFALRELSLADTAELLLSAKGYVNDAFHGSHCEMYTVVNHVAGLARGVYRYVPHAHVLEPVWLGDGRAALSRTFGGPTHNAFQISLAMFAVADLRGRVATDGDRWYRMLNMDAGVLVARLYRTACAFDLACHVNLNFQVRVTEQVLRLPPQWTALAQVLIGGAAQNGRVLDLPLVPQEEWI